MPPRRNTAPVDADRALPVILACRGIDDDSLAAARAIFLETLEASWRARLHVRFAAAASPPAYWLEATTGAGRRAGEPRQAWWPIIVAWDGGDAETTQFLDSLRPGEADRTLIWGAEGAGEALIACKGRETRVAVGGGGAEAFLRRAAHGIALALRPGECPDFPFPGLVRAMTHPLPGQAVLCTIDGHAGGPLACLPVPLWEQGSEGEMLAAPQDRRIKLYRPEREPPPAVLQDVIGRSDVMAKHPGLAAWPCGRAAEIGGVRRWGVVMPALKPGYRPLHHWIDSPVDLELTTGWAEPVWPRLLSVAEGVARTVGHLHDAGFVHGDINHGNVLVDWPAADVQLVDLDGVAPPGFAHQRPKGRWGFAAPEVVAGRPPDCHAERHALALTIAWTLLLRNVMLPLTVHVPQDQLRDDQTAYGPAACFSEHPDDARNRPAGLGRPLFRGGALSCAALPDALRDLMARAFIDGLHCPSRRPAAAEWATALARARQQMTPCQSCRQVVFRTQPPHGCPFCGHDA